MTLSVPLLVSPAWLAAHLDDPDLRLFDLRWSLRGPEGRALYEQGHIPGARYLDLDRDLAAPPSAAAGRHPLPTAADFEAVARREGIGPESHVVVYDDAGGAIAARGWWLLRYFGHERVSLLDGGLAAWAAAGHPLSVTPVSAPAPGTFVARPRPEMVADLAEVERRRGEAGFLLLDARAPERYRGETEPIDTRAGHIPGARNAPYAENLANGRFRDPAALRERYASLGADEALEIVAYCGSGVTAAHDLLALELAGYRARLFPGSWSQWSSQPDLPLATEEEGAGGGSASQ